MAVSLVPIRGNREPYFMCLHAGHEATFRALQRLYVLLPCCFRVWLVSRDQSETSVVTSCRPCSQPRCHFSWIGPLVCCVTGSSELISAPAQLYIGWLCSQISLWSSLGSWSAVRHSSCTAVKTPVYVYVTPSYHSILWFQPLWDCVVILLSYV